MERSVSGSGLASKPLSLVTATVRIHILYTVMRMGECSGRGGIGPCGINESDGEWGSLRERSLFSPFFLRSVISSKRYRVLLYDTS